MKKILVKTEDGSVMTLIPMNLNITKVKGFLKRRSGLEFGKGDLFSQAVGMVMAWMCFHSAEHTDSNEVIAAGVGVTAQHFVDKTGGRIVRDALEDKVLVYVLSPKGHFVVKAEEFFLHILFGEECAEDKVTIKVEPLALTSNESQNAADKLKNINGDEFQINNN